MVSENFVFCPKKLIKNKKQNKYYIAASKKEYIHMFMTRARCFQVKIFRGSNTGDFCFLSCTFLQSPEKNYFLRLIRRPELNCMNQDDEVLLDQIRK